MKIRSETCDSFTSTLCFPSCRSLLRLRAFAGGGNSRSFDGCRRFASRGLYKKSRPNFNRCREKNRAGDSRTAIGMTIMLIFGSTNSLNFWRNSLLWDFRKFKETKLKIILPNSQQENGPIPCPPFEFQTIRISNEIINKQTAPRRNAKLMSKRKPNSLGAFFAFAKICV